MRKLSLLSLASLLAGALFVQESRAEDYTRFNLPEGALARLGKGYIRAMAYSPDGARLAVASSIGIWLYDAATGAETALLTGPTYDVFSVAFSPDGTILAVSQDWTILLSSSYYAVLVSRYCAVRLWDVASGQEIAVLEGHTNRVRSVAFSPDGTMLASGSWDTSWDTTVTLWNVETSKEIATLDGVLVGGVFVGWDDAGVRVWQMMAR